MAPAQGRVETFTVGSIAAACGVTITRVEYVLRSRRVPSIGWAGNARLYGPAALEQVKGELRRIGSGKAARRAD